jgi:predicted PhzF superfamily epimerase YddE/YHI9
VRKLSYFQVDAFTSELFRGNPAGVCLLEGDWLPDDLMQRIAFENNQAETAFVLPRGKVFDLRWFTPALEIDLCGHATLASAFVLFMQCGWTGGVVEFHSKSGPLIVTQKSAFLELDFPSRPGVPATAPPELIDGLGRMPREIYKARDWMAVFDTPDEVLAVKPKFDLLAQVPGGKVIITAPGKDVDFVSRFFAPGAGVNEDPVTGSAHCTLIPYWSARLGKKSLHARQLSQRGGELFCELRGDRVGIGGNAVLYSIGEIHV